MKLSCAVIGVGYFGKHYVRLISHSDKANLSAVAVKTEDSLSRIKDTLPAGVRATTDVQSVLRDPSADAIFIATPVSTHFSLIAEALKNGKHVFVEKPMCSSLDEALKLKRLVDDSGRVFMVGHQYLYNDYIRHIKKVLETGKLGKAKYISAEQLYFTPIRPDIGCFWETATHELASIDYLFDGDELVEAHGQAVDFSGGKRDDFATATLRFKSGLIATVTTSWISPTRSRKFVIGLEKGIITFDDRLTSDKLSIYSVPFPLAEKVEKKTSHWMTLDSYPCESPNIKMAEPLQVEVDAFFQAIENKTTPITDIDHGIRVTRMLDTIYRSFDL